MTVTACLRPARVPGAFAVAAAAVVAACAPALKEAPPLSDLAGGGPPPAADAVDGLLRAAAESFAGRTLDGARRAAALYLRAASADRAPDAPRAGAPDRRIDGVIGSVETLVWLSDHETAPAARESAATRAVQAAQWCPRLAPALPACDYWMGAALGVQARERPATGLSALPRIEAAFAKAAAADPTMDEAGPDRALALLYVRAPGWPTGPGDPGRGLEHARKAATLRPGHPPNLLALAEALAATGDGPGSLAAGHEALRLAEERAAAGDMDASGWIDEARKTIAAAEEHGGAPRAPSAEP